MYLIKMFELGFGTSFLFFFGWMWKYTFGESYFVYLGMYNDGRIQGKDRSHNFE